MAQVLRYLAGAGAGKTTTLLDKVQEYANGGMPLSELLFTSFTNSQISDVQKRIKKIYPHATDSEIKKSVKTLHSAALSVLLAQKKIHLSFSDDYEGFKIITESKKDAYHYIQFAKQYKMYYEMNTNIYDLETDEGAMARLPEANVFFKINSYLGEMGWPASKWVDAASRIGAPISSKFNTEMFEEWAAYKLENMLLEHPDYGNMCLKWQVIPEKRRVFILDEAQDISPLQFRIYKMWMEAFDNVIIAGDQHQSIYSFRGASPYFITSEPSIDIGACGDFRPISHRCPERIVTFADACLGQKSNIEPKCNGGSITIHDELNDSDIVSIITQQQKEHGKVLVLSRYNTEVLDLHKMLNDRAIPHVSFSGRLQEWDKLLLKNKKHFNATSLIKTFHKTPKKAYQTLEEAEFAYKNDQLHRMYRNYFESGRKIDPTTIIVDTIHASKGLEAPSVIIYDNGRISQNCDYSEEKRIFYVAATRSSNQLTLITSVDYNCILGDGIRSISTGGK